MPSLSVAVGKFVGAVLSECAPVLEEIFYRALKRAFSDTAEVSKPNDSLNALIPGLGLRDASNSDGSRVGGNKAG